MYCSFQSTGKAIAIRHSRKGYILSPLERAHQEEERYRSKSPPPFTLKDLGVTVVAPTSTDCPRRQRKKISNRNTDHNTSPLREESNIPKNIPLEDSPTEMTLQRGRITLAQILATPTVPQGQAPPRATTTSTPPPAPPVTTTSIAPPPHRETKAGHKRPNGSSAEQPLAITDFKDSPPDLGDTRLYKCIHGGRGGSSCHR